ncbi:hypothetical protein Vretifemale_3352 [Volvox reticuliferus]|uniref:Uncharacterized protein n=1 Tax=Volvox reticuliferus TaxID=1737510 RepID=A0A8J4C203_9CHLO|nr:hypothetical protein Vretifemale_3352 [Volvox reticuliferus]
MFSGFCPSRKDYMGSSDLFEHNDMHTAVKKCYVYLGCNLRLDGTRVADVVLQAFRVVRHVKGILLVSVNVYNVRRDTSICCLSSVVHHHMKEIKPAGQIQGDGDHA